MHRRTLVGLAGTVVLAAALAACSGSGDTAMNINAGPTPSASVSAGASASAGADEPFGAGCATVPDDPSNAGSFESMAKEPVATAASGNPMLSTLVAAVIRAQLNDTLDKASNITVFAPTNDAFAKIPAADLDAAMADEAKLKSILQYHVVEGELAPNQLAGTHKTMEGSDLTIAGSGNEYTINESAKIVCGNVSTSNATVYIIDGVLMPKS